MKKLFEALSVCLLIVVLCTSAMAEPFTLRSGIVFGDTMETILQKETTLVRESDDSNWFDGKIAGYSKAQCGFYFDDDGKLVSMDYSFGGDVCTSREAMNDVYKTLYQSLTRKYGSPLGNTGGSCHLITGPAIDRMSVWVYLLGSIDGWNGDYTDYDEWVVDDGSDHVKIDIISYYYRDQDYNYTYKVDVSYHHYTDDDFAEALRNKQGERDEVDNDM